MLHVLVYKNKSYIKLSRYETYSINGKTPKRGNGDNEWAIVDGEINIIERLQEKEGDLLYYRRIESAPDNLPATLPADAFEYNYEHELTINKYGYDNSFYEEIREPNKVIRNSIPFIVIDKNCKPVEMEKWVKVTWPSNVEQYPETHHKYPCYITVEDLFFLVHDAIQDKTNKESRLLMNSYRNIGTFTINRIVDGNARELFTYNGFYKNSKKQHEIVPKQIHGENYKDLKAKVQKHIDEVVGMVDLNRYKTCKTCQGKGIIHEKNS